MSTLNDAVARVIRRELADRQEDVTKFAVRAGKTATTGWRQIEGKSRMSIDDAETYARALGWTLTELLDRAQRISLSELGGRIEADLPPAVAADVDRARAHIAAQRKPKKSTERPTGT